MTESESLEKDMTVGSNKFSYKAISEATVLNNVKPLLKTHGVILFPIKVESKEIRDEVETSKGTTTRLLTQIHATYKICDVDSGECELLETVGNGVDTQDKGTGKAMTYAYKTLLQKTFMLFSGEDTDNTHSQEIDAKGVNKKTQPKETKKADENLATQKELDEIKELYKTSGLSKDELKTLVSTTVGINTLNGLSKVNYTKIKAKLSEITKRE